MKTNDYLIAGQYAAPGRLREKGKRLWLAALVGFGLGVVAGSAYLLLGGEYIFDVPRWAVISFYPGFVAGFKVYDLVHLEWLAKVVGVITVGASYAILSLLVSWVWCVVRPKD